MPLRGTANPAQTGATSTQSLESDERRQRARMLYVLLGAVIFGNILFVASTIFPTPADALGPLQRSLPSIVVCVALLFAVRAGYTRAASVALIVSLWVILTWNASIAGGVRAPAFVSYVGIIFAAGLLLGQRAGILQAIACMASGYWLVWLEQTGRLPESVASSTPMHFWWSTFAIAFVVAVLGTLAARMSASALATARRELAMRRRTEEEILQLNEELEARVRARTVELEDANKELEAFSYSVSHDLRAPLRAIDGFSEILFDEYGDELTADARRCHESLRSNVAKMGQLIDDLLKFARLGREPLRTSSVDPATVAQRAWEHLDLSRRDREVKFVVHPMPACQADASLLEQVYANLLSNALKFTRTRQDASVEVGCATKDGESVFYVRDNGVGFDPRFVDRLFGVFQRLHLAEDYEGSGLGLAIVERIVHRHGGSVWAEGALEAGAAFHFTLAASDSAAERPRLHAA